MAGNRRKFGIRNRMDGGWIQCEKTDIVSGMEKKLAFARRRYVDRRKDPGLSLFEQNQGIWMHPDESGEGEKTQCPHTDNR